MSVTLEETKIGNTTTEVVLRDDGKLETRHTSVHENVTVRIGDTVTSWGSMTTSVVEVEGEQGKATPL